MWRIPLCTKWLAGAHFRGTDADLEDLNALALEIASLFFHRLAMLTRTALPAGAPPDTVARFANIDLQALLRDGDRRVARGGDVRRRAPRRG